MNGFFKIIKEYLAVIIVLAGVISSFVVMKSTVEQHGIRIEKLENENKKTEDRLARLETKLDMILEFIKQLREKK